MAGNNQVEPFDEDKLFRFTMKKKWDEVLKAYQMYPNDAPMAKLTKSEETALHIAVSSFHTDLDAEWVRKLVDTFPTEKAEEILGMANDQGSTPLHFAAALGSVDICFCIASKSHKLMEKRNRNGETPFFLAARHGKLDAFVCLHNVWKKSKKEEPVELFRRNDGSNILHEAISGEHFELAYQIILKYEKLVDRKNAEGLSPLRILAKKPSVFYSSSNLRLFDKITYHCLIVRKLKEKDFATEYHKNNSRQKSNGNYPPNYETFMNLVQKSWSFFNIILVSKRGQNEKHQGEDEESQGGNNAGKSSASTVPSEYQDSEGNNAGKSSASTVPEMEEKYEGSIPPNYATFIDLVKFAMNIVLIMLGIGISRIVKIKGKKENHTWAFQIMNQLMEHEKGYKYSHNGQFPGAEYEKKFPTPDIPFEGDEPDNPSVEEGSQSKQNEERDEDTPVEEETYAVVTAKLKDSQMTEKLHAILPDGFEKLEDPPQGFVLLKYQKKKTLDTKTEPETVILFAAKRGITEIVDKILDTFPVAIQDVDKHGKNALLLAVENRQTMVFDSLMKRKLPEFVLYQLDKEGNSALHLSAAFQPQQQPWRIPGAALQMQWEIKWFEHVKKIMPPQCFVHCKYNKNGETAEQIFTTTHEKLVKDGSDWLIKTAESCSVVAALIATVAFATSTTVPGGNDDDGSPVLKGRPAFDVFSIGSLVALCSSVTALVFFLAILTSRCQEGDFRKSLPRKLLLGLSSLFTSIAAILLAFCAGHFFVLTEDLHNAAFFVYGITCLPITFFAFQQLPLYFDLIWAITTKVPLRSYEAFSQEGPA